MQIRDQLLIHLLSSHKQLTIVWKKSRKKVKNKSLMYDSAVIQIVMMEAARCKSGNTVRLTTTWKR